MHADKADLHRYSQKQNAEFSQIRGSPRADKLMHYKFYETKRNKTEVM